MVSATPSRAQKQTKHCFARAAAAFTALSLQIIWLSVLLCAVECARGACHGSVAANAEPAADHCDHSSSAPADPCHQHNRNCPASYLRLAAAASNAVVVSQHDFAAPAAVAFVLSRASTPRERPWVSAATAEAISPPQIAAVQSPVPLRI